ncbi:hypothetical protein IQ249_21130 [Lusitaniella coriacea LEGE 07157]|uniref:DUF2007 domain-containing protein n=1 Tax=Lusitaniella coriacea LEGE 07157 TaxID=945747 RepID=A0A8J7J618_9CYAN|nr:hypothetical protein [Lusitaniella coriacea]MBE9118399.1 hypothetical protein [Lusitaniella coriacea LEGE 07157]
MSWIAIRTTSTRWEAEFMQQLLESHGIPSRAISLGASACFLSGQTALQVLPQDKWTAMLLLSPLEEDDTKEENVF